MCVNRLKRFLLRMVSPPGWLTALISIPFFALVIYVLTSGIEDAPLAYVSYAASAYALLLVALRAPDAAEALCRYVHGHPLVQRVRNLQQVQHILTDPMSRAELALYAGLAVNLAYAALKLVSESPTIRCGSAQWRAIICCCRRCALRFCITRGEVRWGAIPCLNGGATACAASCC